MKPLWQSDLKQYPLLFRGKVRDIYDLGDELLLVATDRLSAFDVVFNEPIPQKGALLTQLSLFWFEKTKEIVSNHLSPHPVDELFSTEEEKVNYSLRSMRVRKTKALPVEAVVRGYLAGSGWKDYQKSGSVCGIPLLEGLREATKLPEPIFTPATKEEVGKHDINISFEEMQNRIGSALAEQVRNISLQIYESAREYALGRGILIADTKFEFGVLNGELILIDEVLTSDSSRYWPMTGYQVGISPPSFDKQFVRNYLLEIGWNQEPPAPTLPENIIRKTFEKYREAYEQLTGKKWSVS